MAAVVQPWHSPHRRFRGALANTRESSSCWQSSPTTVTEPRSTLTASLPGPSPSWPSLPHWLSHTLCEARAPRDRNPWPQAGQGWRGPRHTASCLLRSSCLAAVCPQAVQAKGRSPVCVRMWTASWCRSLHRWSHSPQDRGLPPTGSPDPCRSRWCRFRLDATLKVLSQWSQR